MAAAAAAGGGSADKLKIASHFVMSSPTGQLKDVIADVKVIVNDPAVLTPQVISDLREKYLTDHLHVAKKDGQNVRRLSVSIGPCRHGQRRFGCRMVWIIGVWSDWGRLLCKSVTVAGGDICIRSRTATLLPRPQIRQGLRVRSRYHGACRVVSCAMSGHLRACVCVVGCTVHVDH